MAQTATTLANVLKEAWTDSEIQKQYFVDDNPLSRFEQVDATMIGRQAQVPIWSDLNSGGYTSTSAAGGVLNPATNQPTNQALYTLTQHFFQIGLEFSAINQANGSNMQSVVAGKNIEVQGAIASLRNQATRQLVTNGDGIVAGCGTASSVNVVPLVASPSGTAYGYDAIVRNWLRTGAVVDIGTTADTDVLTTGATVTALAESASAPTITVSGSAISTTAGTHFVYIANPNSATAANPELNGLRNMVSPTGALGGLNPATAGQEFWASQRDTSTTVLSLDLMLNLNRGVRQKTGAQVTDVWTGLKQQQNYYSLLQNQVRFAGDAGIGAGNAAAATWNGMRLTSYNACLDSDIWFLTLSDFVRVTGAFKSPTWFSNIQGSNQGAIWTPGTTGFVDGIAYALQIGLRRRNSHAGATGLTA